MIRFYLHHCLRKAHKARACEVQGCPWIDHTYDGTPVSDFRECPLLTIGEAINTGSSPATLSSRRASISEASLDQSPDPVASPENIRPRDPNTIIIDPSTPPYSTRDTESSSSLPMKSDDAAGPGTGADAALPAANALPVQQRETTPFTAIAAGTGGAGGSGAARGTLDGADAPDTVASHPTISTPFLVSGAPRTMSTIDSQPSASLGGPPPGPVRSSNVGLGVSATTTISRSRSERESSQDPLTSRVATIDEPSQEGHGLHAEREEISRRSTSSLLQGVRAVSRRGSEEFELAVRDGHTGEDSGQGGQGRAESE